jgi:hypothetical protein
MAFVQSPVRAELDRVGANYGKAGAASYIATVFRSDRSEAERAAS